MGIEEFKYWDSIRARWNLHGDTLEIAKAYHKGRIDGYKEARLDYTANLSKFIDMFLRESIMTGSKEEFFRRLDECMR